MIICYLFDRVDNRLAKTRCFTTTPSHINISLNFCIDICDIAYTKKIASKNSNIE